MACAGLGEVGGLVGGLQVGGGGGAAAAGGEGDQQQEDDEAGVPGDKIYLIKTRSSEMNIAPRFQAFQRDQVKIMININEH